MNKKMFKKVMKQANIKVDFSESSQLTPNTLKFIKKNGSYYVYFINSNTNIKLVVESQSENRVYKETLKSLGIKLNPYGSVNNINQKRG